MRCVFREEARPASRVGGERTCGHCFGCGASGTVLDWVKTQGVSLPHAVRCRATMRRSMARPWWAWRVRNVRRLPSLAADADEARCCARWQMRITARGNRARRRWAISRSAGSCMANWSTVPARVCQQEPDVPAAAGTLEGRPRGARSSSAWACIAPRAEHLERCLVVPGAGA
ncbi:CHC2 zinc finger domain-containing protein [Paraburkholderia sp. A1RI-2L]|uniref:CHC2 zinc finger domain-containing protein n=1 Tax=Paraburkholderia sp. A1RI-2L TaxID=3028367 RepID=UPI003B9F6964